MRYYIDRENPGELVFHNGPNTSPERYQEIQVVPVDAVVVELPEVSASRIEGSSLTHWVAEGGGRVSFYDSDDLDGYEHRALVCIAAARAERARRDAEKVAPEESDAWAGLDRAEIIRQAEYAHERVKVLNRALDTVKVQLSEKEQQLAEARNTVSILEDAVRGVARAVSS